MSALQQALKEYLAMRRALGYKLEREGRLLPQFLNYVQQRGEQHLSTETAVAWATLPSSAPGWWAARLRMVRGFAVYMHQIDPGHQAPATDLLPCAPRRATPYLYDQAQIAALQAEIDAGRDASHPASRRDDPDLDRVARGHRNAHRRGGRP